MNPSPVPVEAAPIALIGFGEAAQAILQGWRSQKLAPDVRAWDVKSDASCTGQRLAKEADYRAAGIEGAGSNAQAVVAARAIFSLVTADQATAAANETAKEIAKGTFFFDCNSCSPGAKKQSAAVIDAAGGRYVDVAVMSPVHPRLHRTPLLVSGPHASDALPFLQSMGMSAGLVEGGVGAASSVKMVRSIMVKGLEALTIECMLAGRRAGVDHMVLDTLEDSYPGFGWKKRVAYMLERATTHGIRRAAEMREVAKTVADLGLEPAMSDAIVRWQQAAGEMGLDAASFDQNDHVALAEAMLAALDNAAADPQVRPAIQEGRTT